MSNIHFEGERSFSLPPSLVMAKLGDASFLVTCLDHVEAVESATADRAVWKQRTGFKFLSATLDVTLTVIERQADRVRYQAESKGVAATSTVEATLTLQATEQGTKVIYSADVVKRTGVLKIVSAGLIQSSAMSVIDETWAGIERKMMAP